MNSKRALYQDLKKRLEQIHERTQSATSGFESTVHECTAELAGIIAQLDSEVLERTEVEESLRQLSEQLHSMAAKLTLVEQKERQRLARILHDNLQQFLAAASFHIGDLQRTPDREVRQSASAVLDLLGKAIQVTRSLTNELNPPSLQNMSLVQALQWLCRWMRDNHRLRVELSCADQVTLEKEEIRIVLYEAVRELLFNVVKHAGTDTAFVNVAKSGKQLCIEVSDRGCGFDTALLERTEGPTGFGLISIRERIALLGGSIRVESRPRQGSRFTLRVAE